MKSMTGYAYCENTKEDATVSVEIKGYNSRYLDINVFLPSWLSSLESKMREYIASRFKRGKIEVYIRVKELNTELSVSVNSNAAKAYFNSIKTLSSDLGIRKKPDLNMILGLEGVLITEKKFKNSDNYLSLINPLLTEAADKFDSERSREGKHTLNDIISHINLISMNSLVIEEKAPDIETIFKENLRTRFTEVLGSQIDENRILAETAILLTKHTISEELSRLDSHLKEFQHEVQHNPSPGKKLDFLCQEINREVNTIGSKTQVLEISRAVVEMKNALENIREQLKNVE